MARQYEPGIQVDDLVDQMAIGIDFTLRDLQVILGYLPKDLSTRQ